MLVGESRAHSMTGHVISGDITRVVMARLRKENKLLSNICIHTLNNLLVSIDGEPIIGQVQSA
jgi:hypothetical protein